MDEPVTLCLMHQMLAFGLSEAHIIALIRRKRIMIQGEQEDDDEEENSDDNDDNNVEAAAGAGRARGAGGARNGQVTIAALLGAFDRVGEA